MAKVSGIGMTCAVDDSGGTARAIGGQILSSSWQTPRALQDVTGLTSAAHERLALLADFQQSFNCAVDTASGASTFDVFKTAASASPTSRTITNVIQSQTLAVEALLDGANWSRPADGSWAVSSNGMLANGTAPAWS